MRLIRALLLLLAMAATGMPGAAASGLQPEIDTSTPRTAYEGFFTAMGRITVLYDAYRKDTTDSRQYALFQALQGFGGRLFDLGDLPPATRLKHAGIAFGYMADIMLRLPPIPPEEIPGTPPTPAADLPASWTIPGTEIRLQRQTQGRWAGSYAFSAETVERLPEFHAAIIGSPVLRHDLGALTNWREAQHRFRGPLLQGLPVDRLPAPLHTIILGAPLWKILFSLLTVALAWFGVSRVARLVHRRATTAGEWRRPALLLVVPVTLALLAGLATAMIGWEIGLGGLLFDATMLLATLALYLAGAWAAWLLCDLVVEAIIAAPHIPDHSYDANLLRLLSRVIGVVAVVAILLHGANQIGVPALSLLAGVSVGGIALALAAQSTVENLFGGIAIFADRPFRVGDLIQGPSVNGTVERVGPRSSRIRAADGTLTTVPNSDLAKMHITNVTARNTFLFKHLVRLSGDTTRAQAEWLLEELRRRVAAEEAVRKAPGLPRVRLIGFGESSIDIEIFAQVPVATQAAFLEVQERLVLEVMKAVEAGGMRYSFATPPFAAEPATALLPPPPRPA